MFIVGNKEKYKEEEEKNPSYNPYLERAIVNFMGYFLLIFSLYILYGWNPTGPNEHPVLCLRSTS